MPTQFILDENKTPLFAVIPYHEYVKLVPQQIEKMADPEPKPAKNAPLSIRLPNAGATAAIDLHSFVDYWARKGLLAMPINQRAKPFKEFIGRERFTVEALVRACFVPESYRNTMQMVNDVTNAIVATGLFREVKFDSAQLKDDSPFVREKALITESDQTLNIERYSRAVKCLEIVEDNVLEFLKTHGKPVNPIPDDWMRRIPKA